MQDIEKASGTGDGKAKGSCRLVYILYLVSVVIPLANLVGVVMAYINRGDAPEWMQSHYRFQIRTFWIMLLYMFISGLLTMVVIGFLLMLVVLVWYIIRCVKGMQALDRDEPVPNPGTWMFY